MNAAKSRPLLKHVIRGTLLVASLNLAACDDDDDRYHGYYDAPNSVAIADMNGDAANDIVFVATRVDGGYPNPGFAGVITQVPTTPGTFQRALSTAVGFNPSTLAIGNLDGASGPDVAVANSTSGNVSVLLHDPTISVAQLQSTRNLTVGSGAVPYDVAVGDTNNDGLPDLAVADAGTSDNLVLLRRDPATPGSFLAPVTIAIGQPSSAVAIGDINGDGRADLAVANIAPGGAGSVSIFNQSTTTAGAYAGRLDVPAGVEPLAIKLGDMNGDTLIDIVVANNGVGSNGSGVSVILQSAISPGTFLPAVTYATARGAVSVAIEDLNADGRRDLVVANIGGSYSGTISVLLQDPTRAGVFLSATNYNGIYEPLGVAVGNLNGDAFPDIAVADGDRAAVMFQSTTTPGTFAAPVQVGR
jgi:hypothetical protein